MIVLFCMTRLDTVLKEWEWQYAAQGGVSTRVYPWGDIADASRIPTPDLTRSPVIPECHFLFFY